MGVEMLAMFEGLDVSIAELLYSLEGVVYLG